MKLSILGILFGFCFLGALETANAQSTGLVISPTGFYYNFKEQTSTSNTDKVTALYYDLRVGFIMSNNLYIGGIYSAMNREYDGLGSKKRTSLGASIGYFSPNGFYVMGHYYFQSEYKDFGTTILNKGSGFQADLGYFFNVSPSFRVGPQLSYRSFSYGQIQNGTSTTSASLSHNELIPFIALGFFL